MPRKKLTKKLSIRNETTGGEDLSTSRLLLVTTCLLAIGTLGFYHIEGMMVDDTKGDRWVKAFYCCVITLTTVGYGDICPSDKLSHVGRIFIVCLSFFGLGMFCGPIMDFASSWTKRIPGGAFGPGACALAVGMLLFMQIEEMTAINAAYLTIITGTTVGYGDLSPSTDGGRLSTALFAILVVNVIGGMLEPSKNYLSQLCVAKPEPSPSKKKKTKKA